MIELIGWKAMVGAREYKSGEGYELVGSFGRGLTFSMKLWDGGLGELWISGAAVLDLRLICC
jgi:hypothetical protein